MKHLRTALFSILATSLPFTQLAHAQNTGFVQPQPISQEGRFMPGFGNDGLVKVRFTVKADGTTDDIKIIDYLSNQFLNTNLRQTVGKWTFKPGTVGGEAVDFYNQEYVFAVRVNPNAPPMPAPGGRGGPKPDASAAAPAIDFSKMEPIPLALSAQAKELIDAIYASFGEKNYDQAMKDVTKLLRNDAHTVFDYSLGQELRSSILMTNNELFEALEASNLATMHAMNPQGMDQYFLEASLLENALRRKFLLASSTRQNALALASYETLTSQFDIPASDKIHAAAKAIRATMDSPEPMALIAKITDDVWTFTPSRRIFTVTDVQGGKLNRMNARCERKEFKLDYQEGVDWTLPESLGKCEIDFDGKKGTQFTVYEFAE